MPSDGGSSGDSSGTTTGSSSNTGLGGGSSSGSGGSSGSIWNANYGNEGRNYSPNPVTGYPGLPTSGSPANSGVSGQQVSKQPGDENKPWYSTGWGRVAMATLMTMLGLPPMVSALAAKGISNFGDTKVGANGETAADVAARQLGTTASSFNNMTGGAVASTPTLGSGRGGNTSDGVPQQLQPGGGQTIGDLLGGAAGTPAKATGLQGLADQSAAIGLEQAGIARGEYAAAKGRQAQFDPIYQQILNNALGTQNTQNAHAATQWDTYVNSFLPAQKKLADVAMNYDTAGRRDEAGAAARAAVETESAAQRLAQNRDLGRAGVSLSSGHSLALDNATRMATTKLSTGADIAARRNVENTGLGLLSNVSSLGNTIKQGADTSTGIATNAGGLANSTIGSQQSTYNASLQPTAAFFGNAAGATGQAASATGTLMGLNNQSQQIKNQSDSNDSQNLANLAGLVYNVYTSDPKAKKVHGKVSGKKALKSLEDAGVHSWTYKKGEGDGGRHIGRMAGSIKGDPTTPSGRKGIDAISEFGRHHAAIVELSNQVKTLKKRSLADAGRKA